MTRQTVATEASPAALKELGGRGLIAEILNSEVPPTSDALGPENKLIFSVGLLCEIAMLTGRTLKWDPETETFDNDPGASALLGRAYREPWHL